MPQLWAGIDAGKSHHHCVAIDGDGNKLLSRRFANREPEIRTLLGDVASLPGGVEVAWATDLNHGGTGLLRAVFTEHRQPLHYISGRAIHHAAHTYRGEAKTDAKDAVIIADQARIRRDLNLMRPVDDLTAELRLLSARREDLVHDRTRTVNRLRAILLHYFPTLEAAFNYATSKGPLILLTKYQTPGAIRRVGHRRITTWLKGKHCRKATDVATIALQAAAEQHATVAGEAAAARLVGTIARDLLRLREQILEVEAEITAVLPANPLAASLMSIPGFGPRLAADFLAATGTDLSYFETPDRLASFAGLAPVPRDSGKISGNHYRPRRYDRRLLNACFQSAFIAARNCPTSRAFYERKRSEGKSHKQALIALARRRINVIWAVLRDGTVFAAPAT
ncbi:IS110 family transposase [Microbacterium trichothecenolyticum]|uniref:Transposase IS116/IS110/IS902 family protein n=1 Tax=Microbacterium trichothecenolyticum TaxID=69370 RepID=A0A0M2HKS8_MICTR|nr:IS110 family transposase [Microbacterium trichothecenolyticum]KJL45006.1 Transposase IS116/IS110/IS902 family protein [Microbacterium trichothecenolyticum]